MSPVDWFYALIGTVALGYLMGVLSLLIWPKKKNDDSEDDEGGWI